MGRTKRARVKKVTLIEEKILNANEDVINLKKWLKNNGFIDEVGLSLKEFALTGRGVYCKKDLLEGDVLIRIPYHLMITYTTIINNLRVEINKLYMQDLLTLFLAIERKKSDSNWRIYLESLPSHPPNLPGFTIKENLHFLLGNLLETFRESFEKSYERVLKVYKIDYDSYQWAYVMVNTRAVYTNPDVILQIQSQSSEDRNYLSIDKPMMALCPFLDMFNHSNSAKTVAALEFDEISKNWVYSLRTMKPYKKYEQIFINYGAHSNAKLWIEYGFILQENNLDSIEFCLEEVIAIDCRFSQLRKTQFHLIKEHFNEQLSVSAEGVVSFNLRGLLYVLLNPDDSSWSKMVYSDSYSDNALENIRFCCAKLLQNKLEIYKNNLMHVLEDGSFYKYNIDLIERTIKIVCCTN